MTKGERIAAFIGIGMVVVVGIIMILKLTGVI